MPNKPSKTGRFWAKGALRKCWSIDRAPAKKDLEAEDEEEEVSVAGSPIIRAGEY